MAAPPPLTSQPLPTQPTEPGRTPADQANPREVTGELHQR